jgi:hypothetical protein
MRNVGLKLHINASPEVGMKCKLCIKNCHTSCYKYNTRIFLILNKIRKKTVPLQAWSGPECFRKLRFPDYMTTAQDGGKVVSLTHRPPLPPGNGYLNTAVCASFLKINITGNNNRYPGVHVKVPDVFVRL